MATATKKQPAQQADAPLRLLTEKRISLGQAARTIDVHPATIWRWATRGVNGVKLETIRLGGGKLWSSEQALTRFIAATQKKPSR